MTRNGTAAAILSAALGLAFGLQMAPVSAQEKSKDDKSQAMAEKTEKCYGVNAAGKNDCASGANSCAGQSTKARDTKAFVLLPAGACSKIAGGKTTAS
jgi:uncharacterized membrane protein